MKQIAIYGAIDRFNYGDLLFPIILERMFEKHTPEYQIKFYGVIESDLSAYGAKPTKSVESLFDKDNLTDGSIVIVAGGEVLTAQWYKIFSFLIPENLRSYTDAIQQTIPNSILRKIKPSLPGVDLAQPFVIAPGDFGANVKVVYNAVGGLGFEKTEEAESIREKLSNATFVSVRDRSTFDSLFSLNQSKPVELAPDSASLMSVFFPKELLLSKIHPHFEHWINQNKDGYITLQIAKKYALDRSIINSLVDKIEQIYHQTHLPTVLCPIGTAAYHEDQIPLQAIQEKINTPSLLVENPSVFDIMALIANSALFIGTSLHGAVTAMSFEVPNLAITTNYKKVESYLNTWALPDLRNTVDIDNLSQEIDRALSISKMLLEQKRQELVNKSFESFSKMYKALEEPINDSLNHEATRPFLPEVEKKDKEEGIFFKRWLLKIFKFIIKK